MTVFSVYTKELRNVSHLTSLYFPNAEERTLILYFAIPQNLNFPPLYLTILKIKSIFFYNTQLSPSFTQSILGLCLICYISYTFFIVSISFPPSDAICLHL